MSFTGVEKGELGDSKQALLSLSSVVFQPLPPHGLRGCHHGDRTGVSQKTWTETVTAPWGDPAPSHRGAPEPTEAGPHRCHSLCSGSNTGPGSWKVVY